LFDNHNLLMTRRLLRYEGDNQKQTRCRLAVFKSEDKDHSKIQLDTFLIDEKPFEPIPLYGKLPPFDKFVLSVD
jgi:hypothetical protein